MRVGYPRLLNPERISSLRRAQCHPPKADQQVYKPAATSAWRSRRVLLAKYIKRLRCRCTRPSFRTLDQRRKWKSRAEWASILRPRGFLIWKKCRRWVKILDRAVTSTWQMIKALLRPPQCLTDTQLWIQFQVLLSNRPKWQAPVPTSLRSKPVKLECSKTQRAAKILAIIFRIILIIRLRWKI